MLRGEEQVMQEGHLTRVQELSASEESSTAGDLDMTAEKPDLMDCCEVLFPGRGCSYLFIFGLLPVLISIQLHSFVFEDCNKSYLNSIHDADPCPRALC